MPSRVKPNPIMLEDARREGMRYVRSALVQATAGITDPESVSILAKAFAEVNREISALRGRIEGCERIDYLERVQWRARGAAGGIATENTPLGPLMCEAVLGSDGSWSSTYYLNGDRIAVREIKALGLAQRPTTRNRRKKCPAQQ